jgi:hypothetical protein
MFNLEPFQIVFLTFAVAWLFSQALPTSKLQSKIQGTSGLLLITLGCVLTGIVTVPQFLPATIEISNYETASNTQKSTINNNDAMPPNGLVNSTPRSKKIKQQPQSYNNVDDLLNSL